MGVAGAWLWNVNRTEKEVRQILKDPGHPSFFLYAARLLANANLPREVFRDYLNKENFLRNWPAIKRQMRKDSWNHERVLFWGGVYEYLVKDLKAKGTPFVRPKAEVHADPEQQKTGQAIKDMRRSQKMTQTELSRKTGLTQQHIAKIEAGITQPRSQTLKKIRNCFGGYVYPEEPSFTPFFIRDASISRPGTTWIFPDPKGDE